MKFLLKLFIVKFFKALSITSAGRFIENTIIEQAMSQQLKVIHNGVTLLFTCPNPLTRWRVETYSEKEPETLSWIDGMTRDDVLWDIGANIGLYSLYAAKRHDMKVISFEPSVFNLELLGRNCHINKACENVTIIPLALSDRTGSNLMKHSDTKWGGALSSFSVDYGGDGEVFSSVVEYKTLGISADDAVTKLMLPVPTYIKIDVDGIEHIILDGAGEILKKVKSVLVEVNDNFQEQAEMVTKILITSGFSLINKEISVFTINSKNINIANQIWKRVTENEISN
ncbi:FkbM family methyltransferase [Alphaproteobacteria bacterium]|nr:FkbM family methyltransferase [Alphaproteobacteria bacterium]